MSLYTVTSGQVVNAADLNQLVNVLQVGSGGTESWKYWIEGGTSNNTGFSVGQWIATQSKGSTPVSVIVDTSITPPNSLSTPTTQQLSSSGFFVGSGSTGTSNTARLGGLYTVQYAWLALFLPVAITALLGCIPHFA